jgi:L-threonine-O-3-phosphate decarboxylase
MEINTHGGDIYSFMEEYNEEPIDFSANVNPLGLPKGVKKVLKNSVNQFSSYPDVNCAKLKIALSEYENINQDCISFGNGAADIIFRLVYALKPNKALLLAPTFAEYELALKNVDCKIDFYYLLLENSFKIRDDLLNEIEDIDILFICNPNNPTGMITDIEFLEKIAKKCKQTNCLLVIDECFIDFMEHSNDYTFKHFLKDYENVLILKAFTKIFAMAGLRLGYCLSYNKELLKMINSANQPWSISVPAQLAGTKALKDKKYIRKTINNISKERLYLTKELQNLGFGVFKSYTNFILIKTSNNMDLYSGLYKKKILIRQCENFKGLDNRYYRIAIKNHNDNSKLISVLKELL